MELTVQNVFGLLIRSKLLSLDETKAMFARWEEEAKEAKTNVARFSAWMVANKYVTEYQAALLARGHAEGFFLGEYKVLDRLGKGRMAGVYRAQHPVGQVVAIKVLPPSKARRRNLLARFHREARLAVRLRHPNIVRAFQTGKQGDVYYLVMEHLEGETLEDMLQRRKKLSPPEAVRLVYQALQGLQHIHEKGLVHRDLKPSNLMLVYSPGTGHDNVLRATVKILDIGLGRSLFEDGGPDLGSHAGLTAEGVLLGTPDYMAPEQARDPRVADVRADVYSLGGVLYHLLAGQPPFPDSNVLTQMIRHATEAPRPLRDFNPAVPDGLQQILNWMLAKDPANRYPTPERAAQALQVFLVAGAEPAAGADADPRMSKYLTWLEVEKGKKPAPAAPAGPHPARIPVALPGQPGQRSGAGAPPASPEAIVVPGQPAPAAVPAVAVEADGQAARRRARKSRRPPPLPAPAIPTAVPTIDVELVPAPVVAVASPFRLSRRDFLLFGVGAGTGALATLLGLGIALLGRRDRRPPEEPPEPKE